MERPEELPEGKGLTRNGYARSEGNDNSARSGSTEKRAETPDAVVDEHMTIHAAAVAAERRGASSERRRPT